MSRIGKKLIKIPEGVEIRKEDRKIIVKGPKGELFWEVRPEVGVEIKEGEIIVSPKKETKKTNAFWGLTRTLIANMIQGVTEGFEKKLEIKGVGYKANMEGEDLILHVGFSHLVKIEKPEGVELSVKKNIIGVSGINKQLVGQIAVKIRKVRPPDPYKGKGIRYLGEVIRIKESKKAVTAA